MSNNKMTVKIEQTHECGQVIEQIWYVDEADFTVEENWLSLFKAPSQDATLHIPERPQSKLAFNGICSKLEINGVEWKDIQMLCQKCGVDILLPDREEQSK